MYAGTFNTSLDNTQDHNLFYWFFKNTSLVNPPLVLWLNGGPGATSMTGLFLENGPLRVVRNGSSSNDFIVELS
jgi:carboxypeptidase C (cathepsin A)